MTEKYLSLEEVRRLSKPIHDHTVHIAKPWRLISPYAAWVSLRLQVPADAITLVSGVCFAVGGIFLAMPTMTGMAIAAGSLLIGWFLDVVDGEVARCQAGPKGRFAGKYLDNLGHIVTVPMFYFGMGWGTGQYFNDIIWVALGFAAALGTAGGAYAMKDRMVLDVLAKHPEMFGSVEIGNALLHKSSPTTDGGSPSWFRRLLSISAAGEVVFIWPMHVLFVAAIISWVASEILWFVRTEQVLLIYASFLTTANLARNSLRFYLVVRRLDRAIERRVASEIRD